VIKVSGSPLEMGRQHGEQLADLLLKYEKLTKASYERVGFIGEKLERILAINEREIQRIVPDLIDELHGVAEGSRISYNNVLSMYLWPEIVSAQHRKVIYSKYYQQEKIAECTAFAACSKATIDGSPFLAQTRDASPSGVEFRIIIIAEPHDGNSYVAMSRPTLNGGYGVNSKGVSIAAPTVYVSDSVDALNSGKPSGITDGTLSKLVMEKCASVEDALEYAKSKPGGYMGLNVVLVDGKSNMAKIERSYGSTNMHVMKNADYSTNFIIGATNHFVSKEMKDLSSSNAEEYPSSYHRYDRIMQLLTSKVRELSLEHLKTFARDHANGPGDLSICRHGNAICTNSAFIIEPSRRKLHVLLGAPCENDFMTFECPN
jgi:predicted choloylglycine hydrolase